MNTLPIICLGALCLIMAVAYTIYGNHSGWQGLVVRGLALSSCIALAQVSGSLKNLTNALPIFITIGLSILILSEALKITNVASDKAQTIASGVINAVGLIIISLGGLSLSEFNIFAVVGGLLFGVAFGLIVCAIKKYKTKDKVFFEIFSFMSIGLVLGFGLMAILHSSHNLSAICTLGGGLVLLFQRLMLSLGKGEKTISYIGNALFIIGLTAITLSIYFY